MTIYLKEWRLHLGLSQVGVANKLRTSHTTYGRWENGKVQLTQDHITKVARIFGISPIDLEFHPDRREDSQKLGKAMELLQRMSPEDAETWLEIGARMPSARK
jgi:transcriptional regulator with XRE-family HTH domain